MTTPASMSELSTTAASNNPPGSDAPSTIDDQIRALAAIVRQNVTKGSDIASASAITIPASGNYFVVTGTTGITSITDTNSWYGREVVLKFSGALTITHSANLILPGAANITTVAGDVAHFVSESSGVWRCSSYTKYSGTYAILGANTFTGLQTWKASADIASAATVDLTAATGNTTRITGTTATSAFTMTAGQWHMCVADGAWPLTYHATTNKLNTGGSNYTCAAGDRVLLHKDGSGVIQATIYTTSGKAVSAGKLVQRVEATPYTTYTSGSYIIPYDNTIPQNTEGGEFITATITPTSSTNRLVIDCTFNGTPTTAATLSIALFQDSIADALRAAGSNFGSGYHQVVSLHHEMAAGTTSATTFKIRAGTHTGGSLAINGTGANRIFGGVNACTLSVMEIST